MLLARLMNISAKAQRAIALGALLLLVGITAIIIWLSVSLIGAKQDALIETRQQAGKLTKMAALKDNLQPSIPENATDRSRHFFLEAQSLTIGRANLQSTIDAIAQSNNLVLASAGGVPDINEMGITLIGLQVDVSGSYEAIQKAIVDIETSRPPLLVREFIVRLASGEAGDRPVELAAQIKIFAAFRLTGEEAMEHAAP